MSCAASLRFRREHFSVIGFDVDGEKVRKLNARRILHSATFPAQRRKVDSGKKFEATKDCRRLAEARMTTLLACPTPLTGRKSRPAITSQKPRSIFETVGSGQLISLRERRTHGTTDEMLLDRFRATGIGSRERYFLVYLPKVRSRQREVFDKDQFGHDEVERHGCLEAGKSLYPAGHDALVTVLRSRGRMWSSCSRHLTRCGNRSRE